MKKLLFICLICIILGACSKEESFMFTIDSIRPEGFLVNCSEQVVAALNETNINSIGYGCEIFVDDSTNLLDEAGKTITIEQFSEGDLINIISTEKVKISKKNRKINAKIIQKMSKKIEVKTENM